MECLALLFDQASKQNIGDLELGNLVVRWREQDIDDEFEDKCAIKYFWCDFLEKARIHVIAIEMSEFLLIASYSTSSFCTV